MKPGGGKAKGSRMEREICCRLSLWATHGERKDCFWRSAMSGGRATVTVRRGESNRQAGDICAVSPEGHFLTERYFLECKHVKNLALPGFLLKRNGLLMAFWGKAQQQAQQHGREPMLIACQNLYPAFVLTRRHGLAHWVEPTIRGPDWDLTLFDDWMRSDAPGAPVRKPRQRLGPFLSRRHAARAAAAG